MRKSLVLLLAVVVMPIWAAEPTASICREFQKLLQMPRGEGLDRKALESSLTIGAKEDGTDHYFNVDVDGDDINDIVSRSCSPSLTPSDPCLLEVKASS